MKRRLLSVFLIVGTFVSAHNGIIKKKGVSRKRSTTDIKQAIGKSFEKLLTCSCSLITSLSRGIDLLAKKTKQLISNNDQFFSKSKAKKIDEYNTRLAKVCSEFEQILKLIEKDTELLDRDFDLS
jgi:hypothetical protein